MLFRKKAVISAVQVTEKWFDAGEVLVGVIDGSAGIPDGVSIDVTNKKVTVKGNPAALKQYSREAILGDWIILGPKMYVMSDLEFTMLYEQATDQTASEHLNCTGCVDELDGKGCYECSRNQADRYTAKKPEVVLSRMTDIQTAQAPMVEGVRGKEA